MKPYTICYMMVSIDGRIDCGMTAQLKGVDSYYRILNELNIPSTLSGRVTAELEMALPGKFQSHSNTSIGREAYSRKADAPGYEIVVDTKGTLLWEKETSSAKPHLIITCTNVPEDYLKYLDEQNISWIACGKDHIDLKRAVEMLAEHFHVERLGIVGGAAINTGFLNEGLLDEIDLLIGPGIDGRREMPSVFEGREEEKPLALKLMGVKPYEDDSVLLRYSL